MSDFVSIPVGGSQSHAAGSPRIAAVVARLLEALEKAGEP